MKEKTKWMCVIYIIGVTAFVIGTIDPLEGTIAIAMGSALFDCRPTIQKIDIGKHLWSN